MFALRLREKMTNELCLFPIKLDSNFDGAVTISDIMRLIHSVFIYPGDAALSVMYGKPLGDFFEVSNVSCGNFFSIATSIMIWCLVLAIFAAVDDSNSAR